MFVLFTSGRHRARDNEGFPSVPPGLGVSNLWLQVHHCYEVRRNFWNPSTDELVTFLEKSNGHSYERHRPALHTSTSWSTRSSIPVSRTGWVVPSPICRHMKSSANDDRHPTPAGTPTSSATSSESTTNEGFATARWHHASCPSSSPAPEKINLTGRAFSTTRQFLSVA